ncbi:MAG: hypothetical protein ABJD11_01115 [Gemmatimonadota bacterium]
MKILFCCMIIAVTACHPKPSSGSSSPDILRVTVQQVLDSAALVGETVAITGRCLAPPVSRSDWQLEDGGAAVYVSEEYPPDCGAATAARSAVTILALVAQDTLPSLGTHPGRVRRNLLRK